MMTVWTTRSWALPSRSTQYFAQALFADSGRVFTICQATESIAVAVLRELPVTDRADQAEVRLAAWLKQKYGWGLFFLRIDWQAIAARLYVGRDWDPAGTDPEGLR